jgi:hypothetical protein
MCARQFRWENRKRSVCFWHKAAYTRTMYSQARRQGIAMVWRGSTGLVRVSPLQQIADQCADDGSANAGAKAMFSMESFAGDAQGQFLFRQ